MRTVRRYLSICAFILRKATLVICDDHCIYPVRLGETGNTWLRSFGRAPGPGQIERRVPMSFLVSPRRSHVIQVVPRLDFEEDDDEHIFAVYVYNAIDPSTIRSWDERQVNPAREGPYYIRAENPNEERIILTRGEFLPEWMASTYGPRVLRDFKVVPMNEGPFQLKTYTVGMLWLRYGKVRPRSFLLDAPQNRWAICAENVPNSEPGRSAMIHVVTYDDPRNYHRYWGPNAPWYEGPWIVEPLMPRDRVRLMTSMIQPRWIGINALNPQFPVILNDFRIMPPIHPDQDDDEEGIYPEGVQPRFTIRPYQNTCMKVDTRYFLQPIVQIESFDTSDDGYDMDTHYAKSTKHLSIDDLDDYESYEKSMSNVQSIRVHESKGGKVIAQTQHTDHMPFYFDKPVDGTPAASALGCFYALICVLAGDKGIRAHVADLS